MPRSCYLNSYVPLVTTRFGREAAKLHCIEPFVDGSIRREPDFNHPFPCITCLCRADKFTPRLNVGDYVAYQTVKRRFGLPDAPHRRLTAVLAVTYKLVSHQQTADWYLEHAFGVPSNCIVRGNPPFSLGESHRQNKSLKHLPDDKFHWKWDDGYRQRSEEFPTVVVCQKLFCNTTWNSPVVHDSDLLAAFKRRTETQNPGRLNCQELQSLLNAVGIQAALGSDEH